MKKKFTFLFPLKITQRIYFFIITSIILTFVVFALLIPFHLLEHEKQQIQTELKAVVAMLKSRSRQTLADLMLKDRSGKPPSENIMRLQEGVNGIAKIYPHISMGYYSKEAEQILAFSPSTPYPLPPLFPTNPLETITHKDQVTLNGENYFIQVEPIELGGSEAGYAWAISKASHIYANARSEALVIFASGLLLVLLLNFFMWRTAKQLKQNLETFSQAIADDSRQHPAKGLSFQRALPELVPILELVRKYQQSAKVTALGQFAGSVVHEIKNPLTTMRGFSQLLLSKLRDEQAISYVQFIIEEVDRLSNLATDFLRLTRVDHPKPETVCICRLFTEMENMIGGKFLTEGIKFNWKMEQKNVNVIADPNLLRQVLLNLLLNAMQALEGMASGVITLNVRQSGKWALLEVSDNGPGIPPDQLDKIFEPFFTTKETGTGLGLSFSKQTIEKQGGRIAIHSRPGRGTTFAVFLPVSTEPCHCREHLCPQQAG